MLKSNTLSASKDESKLCFHCGDSCKGTVLQLDNHDFCCSGCKTVYQLLAAEGLQDYYCIDESSPGKKMDQVALGEKFDYLLHEKITEHLLQFRSKEQSRVLFFVPEIHCSSCIWLLENLPKLHTGVQKVEVNFSKKEVNICFNEDEINIKELVILLATIGYEPQINLENKVKKNLQSKSLYYKIGIAGFCFGNVMLLSFPEYLGIAESGFEAYRSFFSYLILALSIPVVTYCSSSYFSSAVNGLFQKTINIDVPIVLGIIVLFGKSFSEILNEQGAGYLDSLTGLVFFLLIGKWYQSKIYGALSFDRDYKSYFPMGVTKIVAGKEQIIQTHEIQPGDQLLIRNQELIPTDSILSSDRGSVDFSFVTGESDLVNKSKGEYLYAGGKQIGRSIIVEVQKVVNQSYLTQLWNQDAFQKKQSDFSTIIDVVGKYFTIILLSIAVVGAAVWYFIDSSQVFNVVSSVLIVACPCALALTVPFVLGNSVRALGKNGFYAKGTETVEKLSKIDTVVFDKTGTITNPNAYKIKQTGLPLSTVEKQWLKSMVQNSAHPLSQAINNFLPECEIILVNYFDEILGLGISGDVAGNKLQFGSATMVGDTAGNSPATEVFLKINNEIRCSFLFENETRKGFEKIVQHLKKRFKLHLLSGDSSKSQDTFSPFFQKDLIHFNQSPQQKLEYIKTLQKDKHKVVMVGDGLNDAGALKQSEIGIALSDNVYSFSPACDGILDAKSFTKLPKILLYANKSMGLVKWGFVLSFTYNVVGLTLAMSNMINPLISAILMPLSSVTIVLFSTVSSHILAKKVFK